MNADNLTDDELMALVAKANTQAFKALMNRYGRKVFGLAWRLCADKTEAEDLAQEVFFKVWRNAGSWQPQAKLETWLYRLLHNLFIDTRRRMKAPAEPLSDDFCSDADTPEQSLLKKRAEREIAAAVNALPDKQKEALILCYYQGLKAKEAAEILSVSQSALEALLFRARQTLKDKLGDKGE